jgi:hypothetical protein
MTCAKGKNLTQLVFNLCKSNANKKRSLGDSVVVLEKQECKITSINAKLYIPLIHTSAPSESSTKYCSRLSKVKVWIKVCNPQFRGLFGLQVLKCN